MNIGEKRKVLVIDDDRSSSALIVRTLEPQGFRTFTVADPEEGVKKAAELEPDLIFINILFPSSNGLKVSKVIHSDEKLSHVPIVMLISYRGELDPKYTGTIGVVDVIVKPMRAEEILSKTVNLIGEGSPAPDEPVDLEGEVAAEELETLAFDVEESGEDETLPVEEEGLIGEEAVPAGKEDFSHPDIPEGEGFQDLEAEIGEISKEIPYGTEDEGIGREDEESAGKKESAAVESFFLAGDEKDSLVEMNAEADRSIVKRALVIAAFVLIIAGLVVAALQVRKFFFPGVEEKSSVTEIRETPVEVPPAAGPDEEEGPPLTGEKAPETPPAEKTAMQAQDKIFRYSVQAGAFGSEENALSFAEKLKLKGYDAFVEKDESRNIFRVLVGRFDSSGPASEQAGKIQTEEGVKAFVYRK
jgi:DNA-binding response OmpR family regulator/cell division septation protein DedD